MLKIINDLEPFFKDNYKRINIREYARIRGVSPPSASKLLSSFEKEKLLIREEEKNYIYYFADKESKLFIELSKIYWYLQFKRIGLFEHLEQTLTNPLVILFGSFSKAEIKPNSDIDLAIFAVFKTKLTFEKFEKKLGHKIQLFVYKTMGDVKNKELLNNILNGYILLGDW